MITISLTDFEQAHANWCKHFKIVSLPAYLAEQRFLDYLGIDYLGSDNFKSITWVHGFCNLVLVTDFTAQRVRLLISPHHKTILKMIEARE